MSTQTEFDEYKREKTYIRVGNSYARNLLTKRGWKVQSGEWWVDPIKATLVPNLENAFFTQLVREIARAV